MAFYLSPLVDVNEIDLTTTIPAVATSIGVAVLRNTWKGPEKKQVLVADESDLAYAFGEPDKRSYEDWLSASGFLKYGNKLYCTRVMPTNAKFSSNKLTPSSGTGLKFDIIADTATGIVTQAFLASGGTGYEVGEYVKIDGGNQNAQVKVKEIETGVASFIGYPDGNKYTTNFEAGVPTTVDNVGGVGATVAFFATGGEIQDVYLRDGGSGYTTADTLTITTGSGDVTVSVDSVDAVTGAVTGITLAAPAGTLYVSDTVGASDMQTTNAAGLVGTGGTKLVIDYIAKNGGITQLYIMNAGGTTNTGDDYTVGDIITVDDDAGDNNAVLTVAEVDVNGGVVALAITEAGTGYPDPVGIGGSRLITSGGGQGLIVKPTIVAGIVVNAFVVDGGNDYDETDTVAIAFGNIPDGNQPDGNDAILQVDAIFDGVVVDFELTSGGDGGYVTGYDSTTSTLLVSTVLVTGGQGLSMSFTDDKTAAVDLGAIDATDGGNFNYIDGIYENVLVDVVSGGGSGLIVDFRIQNGELVATEVGGELLTIVDGGTGFALLDDLRIDTGVMGGSFDMTFNIAEIGAKGIVDTGELSLVDGGTGYIVGQVYDVNDGLNGEGAQITITEVDNAGTVASDGFDITSGGQGYTDANVTFVAYSGFDMPALQLDDFPTEDPDDFGDDFSVANGEYMWTISSSRGNWADNIRISILDKPTQTALLQDPTLLVSGKPSEYFANVDSQLGQNDDFLILVQAKDQRKNVWVTKETFNVSTDPAALDDTGVTRYAETVVNGASDFIRISLNEDLMVGDSADNPAVITSLADMSQDVWFDLDLGSDGTQDQLSDGEIIEAYELYASAEDIDVNIFIDSNKSTTVKQKLIEICEDRKDCISVIDCPKDIVLNNRGSEAESLRQWRNGTGQYSSGGGFNENTSYAALYGNWIEVYDKYNQKYRWIPVTGHVAGVYARTDDVADPWWAPAGLNRAILTSIRRLAWNPKLGNRDILYSNGINPIVSFSGEGKVVWGQKTMLAKESAFNRVNVRRLFIVLEKAISTAAKYFLFEPNDQITRNQLVNMITPFLMDVQARRGVYDFKVVCDETINTPARIDRNELWCNIFIKPVRSAEFIVLNFVATSTGASFEEAAQAVQ